MTEQKQLKKNDFVELHYIGKIKDGDVFDTNIKEEARKIKLDIKSRPLVICLGQNMILPSIDEFLINKEVGKKYKLELEPEKAFGKRNKDLVKTMPLSAFSKHNVKPEKGMVFTFDSVFGKIISTGSRVMVDFNNPIAGKEVEYDLNIKRIVTDINEKIKALMASFFRKEFDFEIKEKKLIIKLKEESKEIKAFIEIFKEKFNEILSLDLEVIK